MLSVQCVLPLLVNRHCGWNELLTKGILTNGSATAHNKARIDQARVVRPTRSVGGTCVGMVEQTVGLMTPTGCAAHLNNCSAHHLNPQPCTTQLSFIPELLCVTCRYTPDCCASQRWEGMSFSCLCHSSARRTVDRRAVICHTVKLPRIFLMAVRRLDSSNVLWHAHTHTRARARTQTHAQLVPSIWSVLWTYGCNKCGFMKARSLFGDWSFQQTIFCAEINDPYLMI